MITPHVVRHRRAGDFDSPTGQPPEDVGVQPQRSTETPYLPPQGLPDYSGALGNPPKND